MTDLSKTAGLFVLLPCLSGSGQTSQRTRIHPISVVPISQVTMTDNFWLPKTKTVQQTTLPVSFGKCYREGHRGNFLIAGCGYRVHNEELS